MSVAMRGGKLAGVLPCGLVASLQAHAPSAWSPVETDHGPAQ